MSKDNSLDVASSMQAALVSKSAPKTIPVADRSSAVPKSSGQTSLDPVVQTARIEQVEDISVQVAEQSFSVDRIKEMIKELEAALPAASNSLSFHVDEALDRPVITVVDSETGEVVRTLPSEEIIRVAHNIEKMRGILFDSPI